jgi:hypothetical protein
MELIAPLDSFTIAVTLMPALLFHLDITRPRSFQFGVEGLLLNNQKGLVFYLSACAIFLNADRRIPFGGIHSSDLMLRLMQLKYPNFPVKMSLEQAQVLFRLCDRYMRVLLLFFAASGEASYVCGRRLLGRAERHDNAGRDQEE